MSFASNQKKQTIGGPRGQFEQMMIQNERARANREPRFRTEKYEETKNQEPQLRKIIGVRLAEELLAEELKKKLETLNNFIFKLLL